MAASLTARVHFTGENKQGTSKAGNFYCMQKAYVQLPGIPFPQAITLYEGDASKVKQAGQYDVPLVFEIKEGRDVTVTLDLSGSVPVQAQAAAARQSA